MKTLEEVNEQYAKELGFDSWEQLEDMQTKNAVSKHWSKTAKIFAIEVAKEALRNADKRVGMFPNYRNLVQDKILNENNIPKI